jgi:hypothetical protein
LQTFETEMLAESHLTRRLFGSMVRRIAALAEPRGRERMRETTPTQAAGSRIESAKDAKKEILV